jgi:glycosyltransferase involved in cell wall biosynthesis
MYRGKSIAAVVPAYNEEVQIVRVFAAMPAFVDRIIVVDDASKDTTAAVTREAARGDARITLVEHPVNRGVGGARASGIAKAVEAGVDLIVAMDGDAQMDTGEIQHLLDPLVEGLADFSKANRLASGEAWRIMPRHRFMANACLTLLTKIASGYWHVTDSQAGFFALTRDLAARIDFGAIYPRYGCENSMLIHLSVLRARVQDVPSRPIYNVGEVSKIRLWRDWFPVVRLLIHGFFYRLAQKYIIRDFHPLVFFYLTGLFLFGCSFLYLGVIVVARTIVPRLAVSDGVVNFCRYTLGSPMVTLFDLVLLVMGLQMLFFAMWMDMEEHRDLRGGKR